MKNLLTINGYVEGILSKDISVLARAITLVESSKTEHQEISKQIIEKILPYTSKSVRLGITGVPGVGKSTFIEVFGLSLIERGRSLAVLAIDPSSKRGGG